MNKYWLPLIILPALAGCAHKYINTARESLGYEKVSNKSYPHQEKRMARVGDTIAWSYDYSVDTVRARTLTTDRDFTIKGPFFSSQGYKERSYSASLLTKFRGEKHYMVGVGEHTMLVDESGVPANRVMNGDVLVIIPVTFDPADIRFSISEEETKVIDPETFNHRWEILYSGISEDSINLTFRSFQQVRVPQPYHTEILHYPLDQRILTYKDLEIVVDSIDAQSINYTVNIRSNE